MNERNAKDRMRSKSIRQQATGNRQQATGNRQQATGNSTYLLNNRVNYPIAYLLISYSRGIYTAVARSISANFTMAVNELHGNYLTEIEEGSILESKWYNKNQVIDAFRKWMKEENPLFIKQFRVQSC